MDITEERLQHARDGIHCRVASSLHGIQVDIHHHLLANKLFLQSGGNSCPGW